MTAATVRVMADESFAGDSDCGEQIAASGLERVQVSFPAEEGAGDVCRHCGRYIETDEDGRWVDPEATGDDITWREGCDSHDEFIADHEPEEGPGTWCNSAQIIVDDEEDSVTCSISVGDPRGGFSFTVRRVATLYNGDGTVSNPELAGPADPSRALSGRGHAAHGAHRASRGDVRDRRRTMSAAELVERYRLHRAGPHPAPAEGALRVARWEVALEEQKAEGLVRFRWEDDTDYEPESGEKVFDDEERRKLADGRWTALGCVVEVRRFSNPHVCSSCGAIDAGPPLSWPWVSAGSIWGVVMESGEAWAHVNAGRPSVWMLDVEVELALEAGVIQ